MVKLLLPQDLLNGSENKWSLNELVVALIYLCHFHALASFVLGCGLTNEPTQLANSNRTVEVTQILGQMERLMQNEENLDLSEVARRFGTVNEEEIQVRTRSIETQQAVKAVDPKKYTETLEFQYCDFSRRPKPEESPTFREAVSSYLLLKTISQLFSVFLVIFQSL